ncbi:hypothetical protein [Erythrobacter sp. SG61-1L]|uniref:hypothetical protein n=1 Tax=Erythrobacter sp. SG61-1L TaxID=1603897 RepID=UPI000ADCE7BB|nr:hypothetical protein [Erythrobacter sp. SG61-1L]
MRRWLYVVDEEGREIRGSRRSLDNIRDWRDIHRIEGELRAVMGEGCEVRDSQPD